jgi:hypothetical protein
MEKLNLLNTLLPIVTAAVGVWIGRYLKWDLEKKKLRYKERKIFILAMREYLHNSNTWSRGDFKKTVLYSQLRPHLSEKLLKSLDTPSNTLRIYKVGSAVDIDMEWVESFQEVNALERKWSLL